MTNQVTALVNIYKGEISTSFDREHLNHKFNRNRMVGTNHCRNQGSCGTTKRIRNGREVTENVCTSNGTQFISVLEKNIITKPGDILRITGQIEYTVEEHFGGGVFKPHVDILVNGVPSGGAAQNSISVNGGHHYPTNIDASIEVTWAQRTKVELAIKGEYPSNHNEVWHIENKEYHRLTIEHYRVFRDIDSAKNEGAHLLLVSKKLKNIGPNANYVSPNFYSIFKVNHNNVLRGDKIKLHGQLEFHGAIDLSPQVGLFITQGPNEPDYYGTNYFGIATASKSKTNWLPFWAQNAYEAGNGNFEAELRAQIVIDREKVNEELEVRQGYLYSLLFRSIQSEDNPNNMYQLINSQVITHIGDQNSYRTRPRAVRGEDEFSSFHEQELDVEDDDILRITGFCQMGMHNRVTIPVKYKIYIKDPRNNVVDESSCKNFLFPGYIEDVYLRSELLVGLPEERLERGKYRIGAAIAFIHENDQYRVNTPQEKNGFIIDHFRKLTH